MTSSQYLRALRPSLGLIRPPALRQGFHVGRAGASSRLFRDEPSRGEAAPRRRAKGKEDSEYKKMRQRVLEELEAKEMYPETHPRLVRREGRTTSIAKFRENHVNISKEDEPPRDQEQQLPKVPPVHHTLYGTPSSAASPACFWSLVC